MLQKRSTLIKGIYHPTHPEKCRSDVRNIRFDSGWELTVLRKLDGSDTILEWAYEPIAIPYWNPVKCQRSNYYPDFWIKYRTQTGEIKQAIVEVKPLKETRPPMRKGKRFDEAMSTYRVNVAKWTAARQLCAQRGMEFLIITERYLNCI